MKRWCRLLLLLLTACQPVSPPADQHRSLYRFGSVFQFQFRQLTASQADQLMQKIASQLDQMEHQWHPWYPSELSRTNQLLQQQRPFSSSPAMIALIEQSTQLYQLSDGLFNPTIGKLSRLWGFQSEDANASRSPPTVTDIAAWLKQPPSPQAIEIHGTELTGHNPNLQLDFNGFADGYALQLLQQLLQQQGIEHALINATGDLLALGTAENRPWLVGIRDPFSDGAIAKVALQPGEAIFTSGTYQKGFDYQNQHYHHILDPRTGYPATELIAATVISDEPVVGDAAATALVVAGHKDWYRIAQRMRLKAVMLIDQQHRVLLTPDMATRIQWLKTPAPQVELSPALTSDLEQK